MKKPFIVGSPATGKKFIGRKEYLDTLAYFIKYQDKGCMSVCGLPRIGKTSIVRKILDKKSKKIVSVFVNMSTMTSFFDLWNKIIVDLFNQLDKLGISFAFTENKENIEDSCRNKSFEALREYLTDFFRELTKEEYKYIIAIDEFDYVRSGIFGDKYQCGLYLNFLRDVFSQIPDIRLSLIVISRRDIASLEGRIADGSTFHGVFGDYINVYGFNDNDYKKYLKILERNKVTLTSKICNDVEIYGGRSPYLLAQIGNYLCENAGAQDDIKEFTRNQAIIKYYNDLINILKDENYYDTMIKIFIGPQYNLTPEEVKTLENMGYIHYDENKKKRRSLSKDFTHYLHELMWLDDNIVIWPKMNELEKRLREIIEKVLVNKYGNNYENDIRQIYTAKYNNNFDYRKFINLNKADIYISKLKTDFPGKTYKILKVISIWEYKNLINYFWQDGMSDCFLKIEKDELFEKLDFLQRARGPLAHSNPEYLSSEEIHYANLYCDEILSIL